MTPVVRIAVTGSALAVLLCLNATTRGFAQSDTSVVYNFQGHHKGEFPHSALLSDASGALYGTTESGGHRCQNRTGEGCGTVFKLTPSGNDFTEQILHTFRGNVERDGEEPQGGLIADGQGALYGTTENGGGTTACVNGCGTVFKLTIAPKGGYKENILYRFQGGTTDGASPRENLLADNNGDLFGTTAAGGAANIGAIFKLTPSGGGYSETVIHQFGINRFGCYCGGAIPTGSLIEDLGGALYGTTTEGGNGRQCAPHGCGTVFKLTPQASGYTETVLHTFGGVKRLDGSDPRDSLIADANGALYGTTYAGGRNFCGGSGAMAGCGTVFKLMPSGSRYRETVLYRFRGDTNGAGPRSALLLVGNALYSTTEGGGVVCYEGSSSPPQDCGTVFSLTPQGMGYIHTVLHRFGGFFAHDGAFPAGTLIDVDGTVYGTTIDGGKGHRAIACWTQATTGYPFGCGAVYAFALSPNP